MDTLTFSQQITAPSGTPFGGPVRVDVHSDGDYQVHFGMSSSSIFVSFDYTVRAYLSAPDFPTMAFVHAGHVPADGSDNHDESGHSDLLRLYWSQLEAAPSFQATKDYEWGGVIGTVADMVDDLVNTGVGIANGALGAVIGATEEAARWLVASLKPTAIVDVLDGKVLLTAIGTFYGVVGEIVTAFICVIADLLFANRPLNDEERAIARSVFGDTIPYDDIVLTNLGGLSGRGFTAKGADNKIYVNLGSHYRHPLEGSAGSSYTQYGQLLIHELTHAWQISHAQFLPGLMCSMIVTQAEDILGDHVYQYGPAGPDWPSFNPEQQGAIVDQWYAGLGNSIGYRPMDQDNRYFRYIWDDILGHAPPAAAPANLRSSTSTELVATSRHNEQIDLFWAGPDGALDTQWWAPASNWLADHGSFAVSAPATAGPAGPVAALAHTPNRLDVFTVNPDGSVLHKQWAGDWSAPPDQLTGPGGAGPESAVVAIGRTPTHVDAFWIGPDGTVVTQWAEDQPMLGFGDHPAFPVTAPGVAQLGSGLAAVARLPDHLDVFWVGPDGAVFTTWWDGLDPHGNWADHTPYPVTPPGAARFGSPVAAVSRIPEHIDIFWVGMDGAVWTHWWDSAAGNGSWTGHPPFPLTVFDAVGAAAGLAAVARNPLQLDVFWVDPRGAVTTHAWTAGPPTGWLPGGAFAITPPGAARTGSPVASIGRTPDRLDVFWAGLDGSVQTHWWHATAGEGWASHGPFPVTAPAVFGVDAATALATAADALAESGRLSDSGDYDGAAAAASRAVQALQRMTPPTDSTALAYWLQLGNALLDLIVRLRSGGHGDQVAGPVREAIAALQTAAALAGDPITIAGLLRDLSIFASDAGQAELAVTAIVPAAAVLATYRPTADQQEPYHRVYAAVLFDVVARQVAAGHLEAAGPAATATVAQYVAWAASGGAPIEAADSLHTLAIYTARANLLDPAITAEQAAVDLLRAMTPTDAQREQRQFYLARALYTWASELLAAHRQHEAAGPAADAVTAYQQLLEISDNAQYAGFLAEAEQLVASLQP